MTHSSNSRVYWEDTDAGGIVYYANYLKFAERARTELLRDHGIEQKTIREESGIAFVVTRCEIDYHHSAQLDDLLEIRTALHDLRKVRMTMHQEIWRNETKIASLVVALACIDKNGKPTAIPPELILAMSQQTSSCGGHNNDE